MERQQETISPNIIPLVPLQLSTQALQIISPPSEVPSTSLNGGGHTTSLQCKKRELRLNKLTGTCYKMVLHHTVYDKMVHKNGIKVSATKQV